MAPPREPVAKLSLGVRKNVRDEFENKVPALKQAMEKLGFPDYAFVVNPNQIYAYAPEDSYGRNSTGACIHDYFENFISRLSDFTDKGKDTEAVNALQKVAPKNVVSLVPDDDDRFSYCGLDIKEGQVWLYFNADKLGYNIYDAAARISEAIDVAIDAEGIDDLPIGIRRGIKQYLDGKHDERQKRLEKMLGMKYTFEADIAKNLAFLRAHKEQVNDASYIDRLPEFVGYYFEGALSGIGWKGFQGDDMLQDGFNEAAEKGVIRFEVVEKIDEGYYCDCVFEDGECKLRTIPAQFGVNVDSVCEKILDRL
ncbi:hypothetical protein BU17DRAFT_61699 [Hysterangium stoloniferum]|nr:hypothetical protein BU17DRAFT_61699 [Hysterangium stoloniferum]